MSQRQPTGPSGQYNGGYTPLQNWNGTDEQNLGYSQQQQQPSLPPNIPAPYADPANLLTVYPIGMYTPTARVAGHFAPHTETLQASSSASDLYPQYAGTFQNIASPQNSQDMQMRMQMAARMARQLQNPGFNSYGNMSYNQPEVAAQHIQQSSFHSFSYPQTGYADTTYLLQQTASSHTQYQQQPSTQRQKTSPQLQYRSPPLAQQQQPSPQLQYQPQVLPQQPSVSPQPPYLPQLQTQLQQSSVSPQTQYLSPPLGQKQRSSSQQHLPAAQQQFQSPSQHLPAYQLQSHQYQQQPSQQQFQQQSPQQLYQQHSPQQLYQQQSPQQLYQQQSPQQQYSSPQQQYQTSQPTAPVQQQVMPPHTQSYGQQPQPQTISYQQAQGQYPAQYSMGQQASGELSQLQQSQQSPTHPVPSQQQQQPPPAQQQIQQGSQSQHQQQYQQLAHQELQKLSPQFTQALPYSLLPTNPPQVAQQPPTPVSMTGSPAPSITNEYFENYVNRTLKIHSPSPTPKTMPTVSAMARASQASVAGTPTPAPRVAHSSESAVPARKMSAPQLVAESPDPIAKSIDGSTPAGPSPAKRHKSNASSRTSPTPAPSRPGSAVFVELSRLTPEQKSSYKTITGLVEPPTISYRDEESDDDLDWGDGAKDDGDWDMRGSTSFLSPDANDPTIVTPTSGRTGDKDHRTAFQKVETILEDIFEESDTFSANPTQDEVSSSRYFEGLSLDGVSPIISVDTVEKLVRYIMRLRLNKKRSRSRSGDGIPWNDENLSRLFRILEKSMRDAESAEPFPDNGRKSSVLQGKKKGKKTNGEASSADGTPDLDVTGEDVDRGERALDSLKNAAAAAQCCLALWDSDGMPKKVYSEDHMTLAVACIRDQMTKVLFPVVEGLAGEKIQSNFLAHLVSKESAATARAKHSKKVTLFDDSSLASIARSTCAAVPHLAALISRSDMSFPDSLVIQTVYLALGPIFVKEPAVRRGRGSKDGSSGGPTWSVMKSLRTDALGCLRGAFAKYENQRQWIIEETLGSLGKNHQQGSGQTSFQLPDGSSISTLTALLLQLIQAASHGVGSRIRKLRSSRLDLEGIGSPQPEQPNLADEERQVMSDAMNIAAMSTRIIASFLIQKSTGNKSSKAVQDTDFKAILDTVVHDLLLVVYRPEWPAASLFLSILSKALSSALSDTKTSTEANASRSIALDYLGDIAARLRSLELEMNSLPIVPSLDDIIAQPTPEGISLLLNTHSKIEGFLASAARDDSMFKSSGEMSRMIWAQELQVSLGKATSVLERLSTESDENEVQMRDKLHIVVQSIRKALRDVWSTGGGLFESGAHRQAEDATQASYAVARSRALQKAFDPILNLLIESMGLSGVALRSKALRGLAAVVVADPNILSQTEVQGAIVERFADPSPQVRDAAVDLIGKYVVQRSEWIVQYYPLIAARITDTGLNVRKRVVKLLRDMCLSVDSPDTRVEICVALIQAAQDEDDGIKDLVLKSLTEILYPSSFSPKKTAALLVDILDQYRGTEETLEAALEGISKVCDDAGHHDRFAKTIDSLINRMVDATEEVSFDANSHIRAIFLLSSDTPSLIDTIKSSVLITYLRQPPSKNGEIESNKLLLQIFTRSIPFLPKTSSTFAIELSKVVREMIGKPINAMFLPHPVACYCAVVNTLTKDYNGLLALMRSVIAKAPSAPPAQAGLMNYIAALIAEHGGLEEAARKDKVLKDTLATCTGGRPLTEFLFERFLQFSKVATDQTLPILCLSAIFRKTPQLILRPDAEKWMATIGSSSSMESRARLLALLRDFLKSEAKRRALGSTAKDVKDLIGSANELHESGISTAVVQRSIDFIIDGTKSHHHSLQSSAMEVLAFTINQGLYHPLHLLPHLISLETSQDRRVARSALELHAALHTKHATMLNVRYLEFARASFDYQRTISSEVSGHRYGTALLAGWWELLNEKRATRLEFLKNIVRVFDFELLGQDEINPAFVLYVAENLAVLEYLHQEEVMLVIQHLSQRVSEGAAVANAIELAVVNGSGPESLDGKFAVVPSATVQLSQSGPDDTTGDPVSGQSARGVEEEKFSALRLANASIVIALALLTKNLLLDVYSLTEDKCLTFVGGKKSTVGDRAVTRKYPNPTPLDCSRLPMARGVETVDDYISQQATFLQMMREDHGIGWSM